MPKKQDIYPSHQQPQFSIRIPAELLDDIDIYCQREGISKRDFAMAIFRKWLDSGKHIGDNHMASKDEIQQLREDFDQRLTALEQKIKVA